MRFFVVLLCFVVSIGVSRGQDSVNPFSLNTIDGQSLEVGDEEHVLVFFLWETGLDVCYNEIDYLNDLYTKYKDDKVIFVAVTNDKPEKLNALLETRDFLFHQVAGKEGKRVMKIFNNNGLVRTFPRYFILDKKGSIVTSAIGSCERIHDLIESELNK